MQSVDAVEPILAVDRADDRKESGTREGGTSRVKSGGGYRQ